MLIHKLQQVDVTQVYIEGGNPLYGDITISGAKNAALPMMAAALLSEQPTILHNVPYITDTNVMVELLRRLGAEIKIHDDDSAAHGSANRFMQIFTQNVSSYVVDEQLVCKMRASILLLGPLLARFGQARIALPGGCAIGTRPIDIHLSSLMAMGAEIEVNQGWVEARAPKGLQGAEINFHTPSVGATENIAAAAVLASGTTILQNVAKEPEVICFLEMLKAMGADIEGIGSRTLVIRGATSLKGSERRVMGDRIEAGTYAIAAGITDGKLRLAGIDYQTLDDILPTLAACGICAQQDGNSLLCYKVSAISPQHIVTAPYPGFPTDLQAQMTAMLCHANGTSTIRETIYENRFMHVAELNKMGARIKIAGDTSIIDEMDTPCSAEVRATDLRASAALVLFALSHPGTTTTIGDIYHLERGYDRMFSKLIACGANIVAY